MNRKLECLKLCPEQVFYTEALSFTSCARKNEWTQKQLTKSIVVICSIQQPYLTDIWSVIYGDCIGKVCRQSNLHTNRQKCTSSHPVAIMLLWMAICCWGRCTCSAQHQMSTFVNSFVINYIDKCGRRALPPEWLFYATSHQQVSGSYVKKKKKRFIAGR